MLKWVTPYAELHSTHKRPPAGSSQFDRTYIMIRSRTNNTAATPMIWRSFHSLPWNYGINDRHTAKLRVAVVAAAILVVLVRTILYACIICGFMSSVKKQSLTQ